MTIRELAAVLDLDTKTLRRWVKQGCPHKRKGTHRTAPLVFDRAEVLAWMHRMDSDGSGVSTDDASAGDLSDAQQIGLLTKRVNLEVKRLEVKKRERIESQAHEELLDAGEVNRGRLERIVLVKTGLQGLCGKLPGRLVGKTELEIRRVMEAEVDDLLAVFSDGFRGLNG